MPGAIERDVFEIIEHVDPERWIGEGTVIFVVAEEFVRRPRVTGSLGTSRAQAYEQNEREESG